jgi:serine phosphatase RsbU (regulator of sigma subunit)
LLPYIYLGKLLIEIEYQHVMNGMSTRYSSSFSGASTARSCANRSLAVTDAERSVDAQNTIATLLSQVAAELFDCLGATWTSAMTSFGGDMVPIAVYGCTPNITLCAEAAALLIHQGKTGVDLTNRRDILLTSAGDNTSFLVIPIYIQQKLEGIIAVGPKRNLAPYSDDDVELMSASTNLIVELLRTRSLASRIASTISDMQRIRMELETAREIQNRLLPYCIPPVAGLDYYGACTPATELSGDFFDFLDADSGQLTITVGDVCGKGISAAMLMTAVQAGLRTATSAFRGNLGDLVSVLNRIVCEVCPDNLYATMFYAQLDPVGGEIRYVNAGHQAALLIGDRPNRICRLESSGTVLGLRAATVFGLRSVSVEPGDVLVVFTDGVSDACDSNGSELSESGLIDIVRKYPGAPASDLVGRVMEKLEGYSAGDIDDRTLVIARFMRASGHYATRTALASMALSATA